MGTQLTMFAPADGIRFAPFIFRPFTRRYSADLRQHVREVRRLFDWPGARYHDEGQGPDGQPLVYNRWHWHNLPLLTQLHRLPALAARASRAAGVHLKPSYAFLSMYGRDGVCPLHTDRPQCQVTVDYMVDSDAQDALWPLEIEGRAYTLRPGEAVCYSGTGAQHRRLPMPAASDATFANLAFFHFVPLAFQGTVD